MIKIPLRRLQASILIIILVVFLSINQPYIEGENLLLFQIIGGMFITFAVLIRALSSLYIAGHKNSHLIIQGPYSLSRNPLYVCWLCGSIGIGLAVGSLFLAIFLGGIIFFIYNKAIRREEKRLLAYFPQQFSNYMKTTPRWLGKSHKVDFSLSHSLVPILIIQSFLEGSCLFLIYPFSFFITMAQDNGLLPVLLYYL